MKAVLDTVSVLRLSSHQHYLLFNIYTIALHLGRALFNVVRLLNKINMDGHLPPIISCMDGLFLVILLFPTLLLSNPINLFLVLLNSPSVYL